MSTDIADTRLFIILGTKNYLVDLRNNDRKIAQELQGANQYNIPVLIIYDQELTAEEREELNQYIKVLQRYTFEVDFGQEWITKATTEVKRILEGETT